MGARRNTNAPPSGNRSTNLGIGPFSAARYGGLDARLATADGEMEARCHPTPLARNSARSRQALSTPGHRCKWLLPSPTTATLAHPISIASSIRQILCCPTEARPSPGRKRPPFLGPCVACLAWVPDRALSHFPLGLPQHSPSRLVNRGDRAFVTRNVSAPPPHSTTARPRSSYVITLQPRLRVEAT